ncbi:hypothetical protein AYO21_07339 [Fonsecaea monophora]|uniref:NAD(P)-binding protein n=1 Tax=Fonsecaea monophora TaxID=254056 RepID=A0A177F2G1_9EURO|nr:hypothetical protein AYO21_07339 [Fonsecaea monophora]KAH0847271.1 NADPH-dependent 1-acyldihydroxyacetone phosphate reductase [Fonsecaea pedrosoi]OAG38517.1 hypothetical protein AYO21_07339 [Fonsecaea monophora]
MANDDKISSVARKKRTVLITGCSDGGLGSALAIALHEAGLHVYATARNPSKLAQVQAHGIETLTLDVLSAESISAAVAKVTHLDILVNNAGALYSMPISDMSIAQAKELFDLNTWSYLAMTQAFLPRLLESKKGIVVNQTSSAGLAPIAFQSAYNASKAAMIMFSDCMRLELAPFGIRVVDLKSSSASSNNFSNNMGAKLPAGSLYAVARDTVEKVMRGETFPVEVTAEQWANQVARDLLKNDNPPANIWRGTKAWVAWLSSIRPFALPEGLLKKLAGLDVVERAVSKQ